MKGLVEQLRQEQHEARIERERQRRELKLPSSRLEASVNADSLMQMLDMLAEKTDAPLGTASARDGQPWTLMTSTQEVFEGAMRRAESGDECLRAALTVAAAGIDAAQADMRDNKLLLLLESFARKSW